jgi:hypothetical protein
MLASYIVLFSPFSISDIHVQTEYYINFEMTETFNVHTKTFCKKILSNIHSVQNIQLFLNWQQLTYYDGFCCSSHADHVLNN